MRRTATDVRLDVVPPDDALDTQRRLEGLVGDVGGTAIVVTEDDGWSHVVHLPLSVSGARAAAGQAPADPPECGLLVLVVDDDPAVRDVTREALEAGGYRVLTAADGADAVALYAHWRVQVAAVVVDFDMPVMDGPAVIRTLKQVDDRLPVLAVSGYWDEARLRRVRDAGAWHCLSKPHSASELRSELARAVRATGRRVAGRTQGSRRVRSGDPEWPEVRPEAGVGTRTLAGGVVSGQADAKACADTRIAADANESPVVLDDGERRRQAEAGTCAGAMVVKNGSKTRSTTFGGLPPPAFSTPSLT